MSKTHRYSRIPIMRCSYNSVGPWAPVYPRNNLVMLFQNKMEKLQRRYSHNVFIKIKYEL